MSRVVSLIERLEAAEVGNVYLDVKVCLETSHPYGFDPGDDVPPVTTSLDAALALVERVLPGWVYMLVNDHGGYNRAELNEPGGRTVKAIADTMPLALCIAVLKAKETK